MYTDIYIYVYIYTRYMQASSLPQTTLCYLLPLEPLCRLLVILALLPPVHDSLKLI